MIWMPPLGLMLYQASPLLRSLGELEERGMHLADIAPHDATRDFVLLNQQRLVEMELSSQLERKKEELHVLSLRLEEEKSKTENLLYAMLPKHVANLLKEGKAVEAGRGGGGRRRRRRRRACVCETAAPLPQENSESAPSCSATW